MAYEAAKAEDPRQGQVSKELERLEEAIEHLAHTVRCVEDHLGPVLRVEDEIETKAAVDEALVPLADTIHGLAVRVLRQAKRLTRILERLEL